MTPKVPRALGLAGIQAPRLFPQSSPPLTHPLPTQGPQQTARSGEHPSWDIPSLSHAPLGNRLDSDYQKLPSMGLLSDKWGTAPLPSPFFPLVGQAVPLEAKAACL